MTIPRTTTTRLYAVLPGFICFFVFTLMSASASASEGYAQIWGGLTAANTNLADNTAQWGPGAQIGARVGISDFWSLTGGIEGSYHFETDEVPASEVLGIFGGVRYNIDIFQYVPYLGLSLENFILAPSDDPERSRALVGGKLSVGVDWRYSREWSVGGAVEIHAPLADPSNFPIYSTLGVNLSYHFRL